jgi:hypothetical protein
MVFSETCESVFRSTHMFYHFLLKFLFQVSPTIYFVLCPCIFFFWVLSQFSYLFCFVMVGKFALGFSIFILMFCNWYFALFCNLCFEFCCNPPLHKCCLSPSYVALIEYHRLGNLYAIDRGLLASLF